MKIYYLPGKLNFVPNTLSYLIVTDDVQLQLEGIPILNNIQLIIN